MTKSQPHRCYLVLSVVLIIIILLSPFNKFTSNDVKLLHCFIVQSGVTGLIIGFTHTILVKYVTNAHVFKQGILRLLSETGQNYCAARILQLNLVILATLREYSHSFLY